MALLTYTLLRLLFIVGAGAVLYVLGVRNWLLLALAGVAAEPAAPVEPDGADPAGLDRTLDD